MTTSTYFIVVEETFSRMFSVKMKEICMRVARVTVDLFKNVLWTTLGRMILFCLLECTVSAPASGDVHAGTPGIW